MFIRIVTISAFLLLAGCATTGNGTGQPADTAPEPVEEPVELWPPNHKWHTIAGADCVKDLYDGDDLQVTFSLADLLADAAIGSRA